MYLPESGVCKKNVTIVIVAEKMRKALENQMFLFQLAVLIETASEEKYRLLLKK